MATWKEEARLMHGGVRAGEGYALLIQTHEVAKTAFNERLTLSERSWLNLAERHRLE